MRPVSGRTLALAALAAAVAAFAASVLKVFDPDLFHHLALGRHLSRHGLDPGEPFLFPFQGTPAGPAPYWLGSLAIHGWHALFGDAGLPFLPALVGAALAAVLLLDSAPRTGRHTRLSLAATALPLVLAVLGFRYRAAGRPELFATLLAALTLWAVRRLEDGRPRLLWAFPALALLWTNLHPSVVVGIAVVLALPVAGAFRLGFEKVARRPPADPGLGRRVALSVAIAAAGVVAAAATPSPENPILLAFRFLAAGSGFGALAPAPSQASGSAQAILRVIPEMQPIRPHFWVEPFGILLVLTALLLLARWRTARLREVLTVAVFALLAAGAARFAVLLAVACAPIAARHMGELLQQLPERVRSVPARTAGAAACLLAALAAAPIGAMEPMLCPGVGFRPGAYPVRGADYLRDLGFRGRLFNTFQFGGYLSWRELGPPYQDGRGLLHAGEEAAAMWGPLDRRAFALLDAKYRFDALLLAYPDEQPASSAAFQSRFGASDWAADRSTWALVAFDDGGLLYLRRDGAYAEQAARDEYRHALPANATFSPHQDQLLPLLQEFRRSVQESPACALCRYYHAVAAISVGLRDEARASLSAIEDPGCTAHVLPLEEARAEAGRAGGRR